MSNSGNILKSNFIQFTNSNTRVIDTNALVAKRLEGYSNVLREREEEALRALASEPVYDEEGNLVEQDTVDLLTEDESVFEEESVLKASGLEQIQMQCNEMVEEANETAKKLVDDANLMADDIRRKATEEGYQAGMAKAEEEYQSRFLELENMKSELERAYEEKVKEIEPELVDIITGVYEHVFGQNFYSRRDVLVCLINKALMHVDPSSAVSINVSIDDFEMLIGMKSMLFDKIPLRYEPEIIQRDDFLKGQAKIETPFGIIDCSIDTELRELTRTLKMLSYEGRTKE